jgi:hypothetical protein
LTVATAATIWVLVDVSAEIVITYVTDSSVSVSVAVTVGVIVLQDLSDLFWGRVEGV